MRAKWQMYHLRTYHVAVMRAKLGMYSAGSEGKESGNVLSWLSWAQLTQLALLSCCAQSWAQLPSWLSWVAQLSRLGPAGVTQLASAGVSRQLGQQELPGNSWPSQLVQLAQLLSWPSWLSWPSSQLAHA